MELLDPGPLPDPFGLSVSERLQHVRSITLHVMNASRYVEDALGFVGRHLPPKESQKVTLAGDESS